MPLIVDRLAYGVGLDLSAMAAGERAVKASLARIAAFAASPAGIIIGIGTATAAVGVASVAAAAKFQRGWAEVQTILSLTREENDRLVHSVRELSLSVGAGDATNLARAYYQTISSGITNTADALHVMDVASKTAVGGLTSAFTSVDVMTTVLNAFGYKASEVQRVADVLFTTVREGKVLFPELAGSIGRAVPFFAQAGLSIEELGAAMATLTKGGLAAEIAATSLRSVINQVLAPSNEAKEQAAALGVEFGLAALKAKGLGQFMADLEKATGGSAEAMKRFFPDARGLTAVLALTGSQAAEFNRQLDIMATKSAGNANRAFAIMTDTLQGQWQLLKNKLNVELQRMGDTLLVPVLKGFNAITGTAPAFEQSLENVRGLASESARLSSEVLPLAARYDRLVREGVKPGTDGYIEQQEIMKKLVALYPGLADQVDNLGNVLTINTDRLRRYNDELSVTISKEIQKAFSERRTAIAREEDEIQRLSQAYRALQRMEEIAVSSGRGLPTIEDIRNLVTMEAAGAAQVTVPLTKDEVTRAHNFVDLLGQIRTAIEQSQGKIQSYRQDLLAVVKQAGLTDVIMEWASLNDITKKTTDQTKRYSELTELLRSRLALAFDKAKPEEFTKAMADMAEELGAAIPKLGPMLSQLGDRTITGDFVTNLDAAVKAEKAYVDAVQQGDKALREFVEREQGTHFIPGEWEELSAQAKAHWRNIYEDRVQAAKDAKEKEEQLIKEMYQTQEALFKSYLEQMSEDRRRALAQQEHDMQMKGFLGPGIFEMAGVQRPTEPPGMAGPPLPAAAYKDLELATARLKLIVGDAADSMVHDFQIAMAQGKGLDKLIAQIPAEHRAAVAQILQGILSAANDLPPDTRALFEKLLGEMSGNAKDAFGNVEELSQGLFQLGNTAGIIDPKIAALFSGLLNLGSAITKLGKPGGTTPLGLFTTGLGLLGGIVGVLGGRDVPTLEEKLQDADKAVQDFAKSLDALSSTDIQSRRTGMEQLFKMASDLARFAQIPAALAQAKKQIADAMKGDFFGATRLLAQLRPIADLLGVQLPEHLSAARWKTQLDDIAKSFEDAARNAASMSEKEWEAFKKKAEEIGLVIPDSLSKFDTDLIKQLLDQAFGDYEDFIKNIGKISTDTFGGVLEKIQAQFDLFDITDPMQQLKIYLDELKKFTNGVVDLSGLLSKTPDQIDRAMEIIGGLITGIIPGLRGEGGLAGSTQVTKLVQELADILGVSIQQAFKMIEGLITGDLTTQELQDLFKALEGAADAMKNQTDQAQAEQTTFSRNVSITEAQGRTMIGLMTSQLSVQDAMAAHLDGIRNTALNILLSIQRWIQAGSYPTEQPAAAGDTIYNLGPFTINGIATKEDARAAGESAGKAAADAINRTIFRGTARQPGTG